METLDWWVYALYGLIAGIIVLALCVPAASKTQTRTPGKLQSFMEFVLDGLRSTFAGALGEGGQQYLPIILTLFLYVLVSNFLGLIPALHSPTASTGTTIALGLFVFIFVQYVGIKHNGLWGYIKHFFGPVLALAPLLFIIEVIGELAKPFSLGMRLYGNIFGEEYINDLLAHGGSRFFLPLQLPVYALQLFTGAIQAFIFAMLTCAYIATFTASHHDHPEGEMEIPA